ncbi:hypothetical protein [Hyphomicrobium sp. 2TAF46]|uniref:hypothetical protein n=1 Tax=Hyphomicrobium sp. 2TAF46 TaxID=3233019 RepID=UPI003F8E5BE5
MSTAAQESYAPHIAYLLRRGLESPIGRLKLAEATEYLIGQLERNRFNSQRAREVYAMAIDNALWASLSGTKDRRRIYAEYLVSNSRDAHVRRLIAELTNNGARRDQRPVRRHFRWLLGA